MARKKHKRIQNFKGLTKESLIDNITNTEIALNNLAEIATTKILKKEKPKGLNENTKATTIQ